MASSGRQYARRTLSQSLRHWRTTKGRARPATRVFAGPTGDSLKAGATTSCSRSPLPRASGRAGSDLPRQSLHVRHELERVQPDGHNMPCPTARRPSWPRGHGRTADPRPRGGLARRRRRLDQPISRACMRYGSATSVLRGDLRRRWGGRRGGHTLRPGRGHPIIASGAAPPRSGA